MPLGFFEAKSDSSLFLYHTSTITAFILVYVDDIIFMGNSTSHLSIIISRLQDNFPLKDLGQLHYFLGVEASRSSDGLFLSQSQYIQDLLIRADMQYSKPLNSPVSTSSSLSRYDGDSLSDPFLYRNIVGALQYLTLTRPELAFAVNRACQFMHGPTSTHWVAVKRILRYLRHTPHHGLVFRPSASLTLEAYSDADWAGCPDDRRSSTGYCIFLGNNLVSWNSKKKHVVARSSIESEFQALAHATAELCWFQSLLSELRISSIHPPTLWCDNIGATFLSANLVFHSRTKHIEIDLLFVREKVAKKSLLIQYVPTHDQIADIFTKVLYHIGSFFSVTSSRDIRNRNDAIGATIFDHVPQHLRFMCKDFIHLECLIIGSIQHNVFEVRHFCGDRALVTFVKKVLLLFDMESGGCVVELGLELLN
ncbi:uncharacterized mitochondrial protein AtMg00810-like [Impatiens glandulifera]|uniref:uncharacterized mitochondrial protein AtMg00810-like n=1 Tax=Impatiens glandulifera TaxID=253017 RepID=UPI001FB17AE8|nr:uncharacterized mitochondrial protein AtMg00810-like [Impatiens glandulifera]